MKSLFTILTIFLFITTAQAQYGDGTGEPNNPYLIYTTEHLNAIGMESNDWDKHFKLMADINMSGFNYSNALIAPDTNDATLKFDGISFNGTFDGNGHTILYLTITGVNHLGLFGSLSDGAEVKDLCVVDVNIIGSGTFVGGMIGINYTGYLSRCCSSGLVSGEDNVGALVGYNSRGYMFNCYSTTAVKGIDDVGGLVGGNAGNVIHCYSNNIVKGIDRVGGLVGYNLDRVAACFSTSTVTGKDYVGGLVGNNQHACFVNRSYSAGTVNGDKYVGGLVGFNPGNVTNSYSRSMVYGSECVGGLVGQNGKWLWYNEPEAGKIFNCYSTGFISGKSNVGGLVGLLSAGNVNGCLWDIETGGQTTSSGGEGKTTAKMQTASTFLGYGWDFIEETANGTEDIWWIDEGHDYPTLVPKLSAFSPDPHNGATDVSPPLMLRWAPGGSALQHDVYFGNDEQQVADATVDTTSIYRGRQAAEMITYDPGNLELVKTYYWRIDEVNQSDPNSPWKGQVWNFTMSNFIVVDDFESYNSVNEIWFSWHDGLAYWAEPPYFGNGTGSVVGDETSPSSMEETIVHEGKQSMPYEYENDKEDFTKYSEATLTLSYPRDWTYEGISELSLWFHGYPANAPERMYVAIANDTSDPAIVYHDDPGAAGISTWTEWVIPLQAFAGQGIDLTDVSSIAIGFGVRGNQTIPGDRGKMYFDDIRLYPLR